MIQDIAPHSFDNRFIPGKHPAPDSMALLFSGEEVLLRKNDGHAGSANGCAFSVYSCAELQAVLPDLASCDCFYLFSMDGADWFLYYDRTGACSLPPHGDASKDSASEGEPVFYDVSLLRREQILPRHLMFALLTAEHLNRWYHENRYCGSCSHETVHAPDERAMECPACKRRIYPKIMPAVIVAVTNGDEIVLTRYANRPFAYHALVAGFNEIGETLEDTVRREVMEEVGLRVKNLRYYKSQPWAIAGDILSGFFCDVDGDPTIHVDEQELKEAVWVKREDVDGQPDDFSLTNEMMMLFKAGKEPRG